MKMLFASLAGVIALGCASASAEDNTLTAIQKHEGYKLLFDGKDLKGWNNYNSKDVKPGWKVENGELICADPHNAGDLCTSEQYEWFELEFDYKMGEGANSGIIYHITDGHGAVWETGPEVQLEDNPKAADPQKCGWLYALYQPDIDPKTGKTLDTTKPAGEWGHIKIVIGEDKCEHWINGVKYVEYDLHSEDFKKRVAASKFGGMKDFAKSDKGYIALQGDHGTVSFKNIVIKPLKGKK
jgi:hypothetical protein